MWDWKRWLRKVLRIHSPSLAILMRCPCRHCQRFQKLGIARCSYKPGARLMLVKYGDKPSEDIVVASLILTSLTRDHHGTTAVFEDYTKYMAARTFRS